MDICTAGQAGLPIQCDFKMQDLCITSDEALAMESMPPGPVAVIGAGYIACEFAGIFNGMGHEVHMVFRGDKVLRSFDNECRGQVQENMEKRGIKVMEIITECI